MSDGALVVHDLHAGYENVLVLRGVSLRADGDEIVAVIGPNGAGKSTFLKAVSGVVRPTSGSVVFDGDDVTGSRPDRITRRGLGFVPQLDNVFPSLTVSENLDVGAQARRAFCSTMTIPMPRSRMPSSSAKTMSVARGERPAEGSSRRSSDGRPTSARPRARSLR